MLVNLSFAGRSLKKFLPPSILVHFPSVSKKKGGIFPTILCTGICLSESGGGFVVGERGGKG